MFLKCWGMHSSFVCRIAVVRLWGSAFPGGKSIGRWVCTCITLSLFNAIHDILEIVFHTRSFDSVYEGTLLVAPSNTLNSTLIFQWDGKICTVIHDRSRSLLLQLRSSQQPVIAGGTILHFINRRVFVGRRNNAFIRVSAKPLNFFALRVAVGGMGLCPEISCPTIIERAQTGYR